MDMPLIPESLPAEIKVGCHKDNLIAQEQKGLWQVTFNQHIFLLYYIYMYQCITLNHTYIFMNTMYQQYRNVFVCEGL